MTRFVPPPELLDSPYGRELDAPPAARRRPATGPVPARARVVVVGAGLAAIALASHLWHEVGLGGVVLLDRAEHPGHRFLARTGQLRQRVLRSPYEHHVGAHLSRDCELLDFARAQWRHLTELERGQVRMAMSGQRAVVPRDVFAAYLGHVCVNHQIPERTWRASVREVAPDGDRWRVCHSSGVVSAEAVVFATGERSRPAPAGWGGDGRVVPWDAASLDHRGRAVAVLGSGLTAAHAVSELCGSGGRVHWVQRSTERFQCSDVNARFFRPEGRAAFLARGLPERLELLRRQRRPSVMWEFRPVLASWEDQGRLTVHRRSEVVGIDDRPGGLELRLGNGRSLRGIERVVYAFGTDPEPLPLAAPYDTEGGFPVLADRSLEILGQPGTYVTGALASLSVGPAARNIDGMRVAAARIARALVRERRGGQP